MIKTFFADDNNLKVIENFYISLSNQGVFASVFHSDKNRWTAEIIKSILSQPSDWDNNCQDQIESIGSSFIRCIGHIKKDDDDEYNKASVMSFRFLLEFFISTKANLSPSLDGALNFFINNSNGFPENFRSNIEYAIKAIPLSAVKVAINSEAIPFLRDAHEAIQRADGIKKAWNEELEEKGNLVDILRKSLETYKTGFNFVGLHQGFDELLKEKIKEAKIAKIWYLMAALLVLVPLIIQAAFFYYRTQSDIPISSHLLITIVPTASLIFVLLYFFRLFFLEYKAIKSQIIQIELRMTLCRFIQSYSTYASDMKVKDKSSLEKFENIIFSGIVASEGEIPSTYDGVDQLAKLIKSVKG